MPPSPLESQFVEDFALALADLGLPRMPARVLSLLLGSAEESLTAKELGTRLGVSPAAISGAVQHLTRTRMVVRSRTAGERVDRFGLAEHVWDPMLESSAASYEPLARLCAEALDRGEVPAPARGRLAETRDFVDFLAAELPVLARRWRSGRGAGR